MFAGFPEETFAFLRDISSHNDRDWFEAHRADYDAFYVGAGRDVVAALGPRLQVLSPQIRFEPKINGSISRINRDVRFSRDKRPYKDHLDVWFWHGEKRGWDCPGFYLRLTAETVFLGVGMYQFPKQMLKRYQDVVGDPVAAAELQKILAGVAGSGPYEIGGRNRKSPPRGLPTEGASGEMLCYDALSAGIEWDNGVARDESFIDFCLGHWQKCWPVGKWVLDNVWES